MLIMDFYEITHSEVDGTDICTTVRLNPDHEVYKGHFPDQPIVPGVIQLQIVKEILEKYLELKLFMSYVSQVKYLVPVVPGNNPELMIKVSVKQLAEEPLKAKVVISSHEKIFTKAGLGFSVL